MSGAIVVVAMSWAGGTTAAGAPVDVPADPLAPVLPGSTPSIPASGVPLGDAVILLEGVQQDAVPDDFYKEVYVVGPTGGLSFRSFSARGQRLGLTKGAPRALYVSPGGRVTGQALGMQAGSTVALYLLGSATIRQDATTRSDGNARPALRVPDDYPPGPATLQLNGINKVGAAQSISFGVRVARDQVPLVEPVLPTAVRNTGWTRLVRGPIRTNAGQRVQVRVTCEYRTTDPFEGPDRCRTDRDRRGWTRVWMSGREPVRVRVLLRAPATDDYGPYVDVTRYRTRAAR